MADIFNLLDTWNNGATVFTSIKMDATNTASAAGSKLLDLLLDGGSLFSVDKDGIVNIGGGLSRLSHTVAEDLLIEAEDDLRLAAQGAQKLKVATGSFEPISDNILDFGSSTKRIKTLFIGTEIDFDGATIEGSGSDPNNGITISAEGSTGPIILRTNSADIINVGANNVGFAKSLYPLNGTTDLGLSTNNFRDLFLSRNLEFGTNGEILNALNSAAIRFGNSETVVNQDSANLDFRVKADDGTSLMLFDASANHIILDGLPTSDPSVSGALWNDSGTLKVSA